VFAVHLGYAQEKAVSGTVTDPSGIPIPGVNIVVLGTTNGTQTDFDGKYNIKANSGDQLVFSYVGLKSQTITLGESNSVDLTMEEDAAALDEVVVTALGIKREQKALGYAVSKVGKEELEQKANGDLNRLLQGKAAGVNITSTNGLSGSSSNVIIRGATTITGSNQALYVVDGIPFESNSNEQTAFFTGVTESNRALDIDPNNIEDISILKGLSATALYGNRGRNGVILITTKSGSTDSNKGTSRLSITQSVFQSTPHLPTYQDEYMGGFNNTFGWFFSNWGPRFKDPTANYGNFFIRAAEDGTVFVTHPFKSNNVPAFVEGYEDLRDSEYELRPYDSVENFFRTGLTTSTNINLSGGNKNFGYNVGYSKLNDKGFTPGNSLARDNFTVGGNGTLGKLTVNASMNVAITDYKSPPIAASRGSGVIGGGASIFGDIFYTPRNVDLIGIPFERADGGSIYYRSGNGIQHPLWTVKNVKTGQKTTNIFTSFNTLYQFNDNLSASYRFGFNTYFENGFYGQNKGGVDGDITGLLRTTSVVRSNFDHNISLNYTKDLTEKLELSAILGFNSNRREFDRDGVESNGQITFGVLRHFNFTNQLTTSPTAGTLQGRQEENTFGVFGDLTLSYDDFLFLNVQGRNDWTSTLESDNNTVFYPSTSLSFIPTAAFDGLKSNFLNYLKLRAGYGSSAGFPPTYTTRTGLALNGNLFVDQNFENGNISGNNTDGLRGNPNLKPELVSELEFGLDAKLWDNRIGLNASVFKRTTTDLITRRDLPPTEGFTIEYINAGELENKGIELGLTADIFRNPDGFNWNVGVNFYADDPVITKLPDGVDRITIGGSATVDDARNAAVAGQPYGVFLGTSVATDDQGNFLVNNAGNYIATTDNDQIIGDPNIDYTANFTTSFGYKNWRLGVDLAYRHGGDVYSRTVATLSGRGVTDFPLTRENTFVLPGVNNVTGEPNTVQINATDIAFNNWLFGPSSFKVYDGSQLRLNEVSLSYDFKKSSLKNTPFSNINITILGSNLWYRSFNIPETANFDVNVNSTGQGNNQGLEFFAGPSAARYGFSVKLDF
jgi:TonB-linked SusC/RagA family outer membrane protein